MHAAAAARVDPRPSADPRAVARLAPLKMVCRGSSPDTLHSLLTAALERQAWAAAPPGLLQQLHPTPGLPFAAGGAQPGRVGPRERGERPASAGAQATGPQPNWAVVEGLCAIGYPRLHAVNAVLATQNAGAWPAADGGCRRPPGASACLLPCADALLPPACCRAPTPCCRMLIDPLPTHALHSWAGVQAAVNWLCDNEGSPSLTQPSPFLPDSSSSGGGGGGGGGGQQAGAAAAYPPPPPGPLAAGSVVARGGQPEPSGASFSNPLLAGQGSQASTAGSSGWGFGAAPGGGASGAGLSNFGSGGSLGVQRSAPSLGVGVAGILKQEEMRAARTDA